MRIAVSYRNPGLLSTTKEVIVSRLYGDIVSNRSSKPATKPGDRFISAHVRGWDIGAEVTISINEDGKEEIVVRLTGGSNSPMPRDIVYSYKQPVERKPDLFGEPLLG